MAQSKKPRKPYRRPNFRAEAAGLNPEKYGEQARAEQAGESQSAEQAHPESVPIDKEPVAPAHPHVTHRALRGRGRYLVPVAAGAGVVGGGAFLAHRARRRKAEMAKGLIDPTTGESVTFGKRYIDDEVDEKPRGVLVAKDDKGPSAGRRVAGGLLPGYHGLAAGKKGKKGRTFGNEAGGALLGAAALATATRGKLLRGAHAASLDHVGHALSDWDGSGGSMARAMLRGSGRTYKDPRYLRALGASTAANATGAQLGVNRNQRKGYYKPQSASKRFDESALEHTGSRRVGGRLPVSTVRTAGLPVQSATFSRGNPEARPGTRSHANKLTHVHTKVKAPRTGKLYQLHHRSRSKSGTSIGKSAGYAQSAGNGRRLVNV